MFCKRCVTLSGKWVSIRRSVKSSASRTIGVSSTAPTPSMGTHFSSHTRLSTWGLRSTPSYPGAITQIRWQRKLTTPLLSLRRNLSSCPRQIRATCYKSLVRPQLEYASTVWDHTNKTHINTIEAVQRRAARFITGDYRQESSVTAMFRNLQLESLQERRLRARAAMMFRVVSNLIDLSSGPLHPSGTATRGHTQRYIQPFCHIKSYQDSFYPVDIVIWNSLPQDVTNADSLESFKTRISAHRFT